MASARVLSARRKALRAAFSLAAGLLPLGFVPAILPGAGLLAVKPSRLVFGLGGVLERLFGVPGDEDERLFAGLGEGLDRPFAAIEAAGAPRISARVRPIPPTRAIRCSMPSPSKPLR